MYNSVLRTCVTKKNSSVVTALCSVIQPILVVCGWAVQLTEEHCNADNKTVYNSVERTCVTKNVRVWTAQMTEEHCNANISREEPERVVCNSVARTVSLRKLIGCDCEAV